jgi:thiol:disulfide interchange protein DsbD
MPLAIQQKVTRISQGLRGGTLSGAAIMGALSALIVGPCVAAPLAGTLIYIGETGDAILGGAALFALGIGMGFPLLLIGASAGKLLPKAGKWMDGVKAVFGAGFLATALWLLSRILPGSVLMALWGSFLISAAVYLGALDPIGAGSSGWKRLFKPSTHPTLLRRDQMWARDCGGRFVPTESANRHGRCRSTVKVAFKAVTQFMA